MAALTRQMKLYDFARECFVNGHELLAIQGFDLNIMDVSGLSYADMNHIAGAVPETNC
jgi:hypothetical protein